jgi:hypothetical protein
MLSRSSQDRGDQHKARVPLSAATAEWWIADGGAQAIVDQEILHLDSRWPFPENLGRESASDSADREGEREKAEIADMCENHQRKSAPNLKIVYDAVRD